MEPIILHSILFIILLLCIYYYKKRIENFDDNDDDIVKFTLSNSDKTKFFYYDDDDDKFLFSKEPVVFKTKQKYVSNGNIPLMIDNKYLQYLMKKNDDTKFILDEIDPSYIQLKYNVSTKRIKIGSDSYLSTNNYSSIAENTESGLPLYMKIQ